MPVNVETGVDGAGGSRRSVDGHADDDDDDDFEKVKRDDDDGGGRDNNDRHGNGLAIGTSGRSRSSGEGGLSGGRMGGDESIDMGATVSDADADDDDDDDDDASATTTVGVGRGGGEVGN
jgi:hypothetical protein